MTLPSVIDTHAHLSAEEFDHDLPEVLKRAEKAGVRRIIAVGETLQDARKLLDLSRKFPLILPAAGLYPTYLDVAHARRIHDFILSHRESLAAIGEVGLDYWKVKEEEDREIQREIFRHFIRLSNQFGLPLNVHSRSAGHQAIALLLREKARKVQLHAFDGRVSAALVGVEAGYFFSIPPSVVRSRQKQKLAKRLPLSALLVETDSPVLGPDPGKRNEPANVQDAVSTLAELKGISIGKMAEILMENTFRLYGAILNDKDPGSYSLTEG